MGYQIQVTTGHRLPRVLLPDDVTEMMSMYRRGDSLSAIARQFGITHERVRRVLKLPVGARPVKPPPNPVTAKTVPRCRRGTSLLAEAPPGEDGLCGYCVEELRAVEDG